MRPRRKTLVAWSSTAALLAAGCVAVTPAHAAPRADGAGAWTETFQLPDGPYTGGDHFTLPASPEMAGIKNKQLMLTVGKSGDAPLLAAKKEFHTKSGRAEVTLKAAPGAGIVSFVALRGPRLGDGCGTAQPDTYQQTWNQDEISSQFLGAEPDVSQSTYIIRGNTATYDRDNYHPVNTQEFHSYGIEWSADHVKWSVDGTVVRTLTPEQVKDGSWFCGDPMGIHLGMWAADSKDEPGIIEWAGGPTDYTKGPFTMEVKSVSYTPLPSCCGS